MMTISSTDCESQEKPKDKYALLRREMVDRQIIARGIADKEVIQAMLNVPRHLYVPVEYKMNAYADHPLPIGEGQTISQPYIVAFMTEVLQPDSTSRVLEIGTGSGYQAAVLAEICDSVFTIEIYESLGQQARKTLKEQKYTNVQVKIGDGYEGWPEKAPFDAIIVTCSPTHIPEPLQKQLKEGGKMIIPIGQFYNQELILLKKRKGKMISKDILPVRFVPMINVEGQKY
ncbi:MAG: protein-L-isoaspartate(D-aspartate) O-methyltransferase [Bacteroidales bacterium]